MDFCNKSRKMNTSIEHDLEFRLLLKWNFFQNVTFFARIHKKLSKNNIFFTKKSEICIFYAI